MSSTNKTTNYELSQFIGTDKPAWLTDYNADMSKIDAGVATAQGTATGADTKATANATAIGTLSNLTTEAKTSLVAAINEVDTHADAAAGTAADAASTANTASATASTALHDVNALANYFTLTPTQVAWGDISPTNCTLEGANITIAKNSTSSFGKIYGRITVRTTAAATCTITLNIDSGIHPDSDLAIGPAGLGFLVSTSAHGNSHGENASITIKPNGNIVIKWWAAAAGSHVCYLWPCCYFFTDFGDLPDNA